MASAEISPTDVVAALDELTIDKTKELFFHLKVKLKTLNDIDTAHTGNMRKIHYVQAWFDQEVGASWEKIVAGLKQIGMKALAESLATRKCLGSLTPDPRSSPVTTAPAPETSGPQTSGSTEPSLGPVARLSSPSDRISQVWAEIDRLTDTFSHLVSDTRDEMCIRASVEPQFFNKFRDRLLDLPVSQKSPHAKFFDEKLDDFLMAKNMDKIFAILRRYSNYRNYAVLREVVRRFCEAVLQRRMQEYCKSLEKFEKATFIDVYLQAISAGIVLTSEFTKMTVKINKPASACTVHEVRKLKETIAERASLQPYSMYIEEESIDLKLGFPASCVGWILGVLTPEFLATHRLSDVVVRQQNQSTSLHQNHLSILERTQAELTKELCTASRRGDMMRVVSLLNSGAHMETEDEWSLTPLGSASFYGHLQVVRLLTSRRANPNYVNKAGLTALMNAVNGGKSDVVTELISLKADVDFQSKKNGNSALIEAVLRSLTDVVVELIRAGANINLQNNNGDTAAILAVERYYPDIVRELVRAGSDLNLQNQEGLTPLMIAARRGRTDITTILLEGEHINLDIQENVRVATMYAQLPVWHNN
ncbi:Putative ankyrin repeat protein MM_0045 [Geodia barretti]|uniref:Ankyrin repeat protein MM_0045 n=1 Tax=Geodia barretti TaxID=519541 RepID=A0AA35TMX5_GEOBA|nr:Putative ankyrin repeat protein MM_0045 [Geodia barretti]